MIIIIIIIIITVIYKILLKWCKVGNREMQYGMCTKNLKKTKILKSQEYSNCHKSLSQERINGRYRTSKQYVTKS